METMTIDERLEKIIFRIKEQRKLKGFSHENMADELDISPSAYNKIEKQSSRLTLHRFLNIQKILNVPLSEFFDIKNTNIYNQEVKDNAIGHQEIQTLNQENKELTKNFIAFLQKEIVFLRELLNSK